MRQSFVSLVLYSKNSQDPMSLRLIHSGRNHSFAPISRFLATVMKEKLKECSHVYSSTEASLADLKHLCINDDVVLVRVDIEDFPQG